MAHTILRILQVHFKIPRQVSDSLNSGLTEEEMKSIETISSEKHMLDNSHDNMHTKIRTSAPNVNRLRTPNNALSSTARSLPSRRNTSKMSRNSLGKHENRCYGSSNWTWKFGPLI